VPDFLSEKRKEIAARMIVLKPIVDEYQRLEAAATALAGVPAGRARVGVATGRRHGPGRPRGSQNAPQAAAATAAPAARAGRKRVAGASAAPKATPRRGRRKGSGGRSTEAMTFINEQPGITIPELAARMGIKQNYLYQVLPKLGQEGKVHKRGRGWHPSASA